MPTKISLPSLPKDKEFEEYVSAFLQASGLYVERSIINREEEEILELDIITTKYSDGSAPDETLIEVKSGGWGFSEIFKLIGWGNYLNLRNIKLVICKKKSNQSFYETKAGEIGVIIRYHSNDTDKLDGSNIVNNESVDSLDVSQWRFSYWLERVLLNKLTAKKKSLKERKCYKVLDAYFYMINSGIFFTKNVIKRADTIYEAYKTQPHLSAKVGNEMDGKDFDDDHEAIPTNIFKDTFYRSQFTDISISTYVEYRARLALLKAAVDFSLFEKYGIKERIKDEIEVPGYYSSLKYILPDSFIEGLEEIKKHTYYHRYPVFWQHFLWQFGGFILEDYKEQEYKMFSVKTGVPISEIDNALKAFDLLFPIPGGWFNPCNPNTNITHLKMFSMPFMGIGANYRRLMYGGEDGYDGLSLTGKYTRNDLLSWNNLVVDVLT